MTESTGQERRLGRWSKVLVVDDHPLFCDAMAMTIEEIFAHPEVKKAHSLSKAVDLLESFPVDLIVLDLNLPDVEGIGGLIRLRNLTPTAKIVVVSSISDNRVIASVFEAGAVGFVAKDASRNELVKLFATTESGGIYRPRDFVVPGEARGVDQEQRDIIESLESLTPQQGTILTLICQGKLNKQIAHELEIAETTVKAHLTAIFRKLKVHNRTQAVLLANRVSYSSLAENNQIQ